jgi:hypothetical protein
MVTLPAAEARRGTATLVGMPSAFLMPMIAATGNCDPGLPAVCFGDLLGDAIDSRND